ncbi:MAG: DUF4383 domain-containing protein [Nanoarchaeota archaeon]
MASTQKIFALVLGIVLLLVGILGFINNPLVGETGIFTTNTLQDVLHIIAGLAGLWIGIMGSGPGYNMTIGWIGILLGVLGFIPGASDLLLTYLNITQIITILHLVIGVIALGVYYMTDKD